MRKCIKCVGGHGRCFAVGSHFLSGLSGQWSLFSMQTVGFSEPVTALAEWNLLSSALHSFFSFFFSPLLMIV